MIELCDTFVAPEYHDKVLEFFDLSTLADRLHDEETLATEYLAKDGNWHTARFIVKNVITMEMLPIFFMLQDL